MIILVLGVVMGPSTVHALKLKGQMKGSNSWDYLGRFCFLPSEFSTTGTDKLEVRT